MEIKDRLYPHPVLWHKKDDYKTSMFDCDISLSRDIKKFVLDVDFKLDNKGLLALIEANKAEYILHIESPRSSYRLISSSKKSKIKIELLDCHLVGKISLCPFIILKEDLNDYSNEDFNDEYENSLFTLTKGTILAIADSFSFNVDKDNEDFAKVSSIFTVYKKEITEDMPMEIELNDNKIKIGLNVPDYENYSDLIKHSSNIINSFILFPTLVYTFSEMRENLENYRNYNWFNAIEYIFRKYNLDLDAELETKNAVELAQRIMITPVNKALVEFKQIVERQDEE